MASDERTSAAASTYNRLAERSAASMAGICPVCKTLAQHMRQLQIRMECKPNG